MHGYNNINLICDIYIIVSNCIVRLFSTEYDSIFAEKSKA